MLARIIYEAKLKTCATTGLTISCYRERHHVFAIQEICKFNKFLGPRPKHTEHLTNFQVTVKLQTPKITADRLI